MTMNNGGVANGTASDDDAYDQFLQYVNSKEEAAPAPTVKIVASKAVAIESDVEAGGGAGTKTTTPTATSHYSSYSRQSTRNANNGTAHSSSRYSVRRRSSTTTEERRNPFALREGNALIWRNVNMTLVSARLYDYTYPVHRKELMCMMLMTEINESNSYVPSDTST